MLVNLISISKGYLNNSLINKASVFLDEESDDIKKSISAILIAIYGKIIDNSNESKKELNRIYKAIITSHFSNLDYINLNDVFSGENSLLIDESSNFLDFLYENKQDILASIISDVYKIHKESASGLLRMVLPIVVGSINKVLNREQLNTHGFHLLLKQQEKYINNTKISVFFIEKFADTFKVNFLQNYTPTENKITTKSKINNLKFKNIAAVIAGFLILGSVYFTSIEAIEKPSKNNAGRVRNSKDVISNTIDDYNSFYNPSEQTLGKYIKKYEFLGCFIEKELKDKTKIVILSNGSEAKLINFIEKSDLNVDNNYWIALRRVTHHKGTHLVSELSNNQINNLVAILRAYPEVNITIGGYSYNQADPVKNFEASYRFVEEVTKKILQSDIDESRITFEGYGDNYQLKKGPLPVKRISVKVTKK